MKHVAIELIERRKNNAGMNDEILILNTPTVNAKALYHKDQSVEILSGTTMKLYGQHEMKNMRMLYLKMLGSGVIEERTDGQAVFVKNYYFRDLNMAAQFLMHRGGDNSSAWKKERSAASRTKNSKGSPQKRATGRKTVINVRKQKKKKPYQQKQSGTNRTDIQKPADKAKRKNAPLHQKKGKLTAKTSQHRNYKRRQTMADKMHIAPQKGVTSQKKDNRASTGLLTNLYTFRH